jgi:hypothetical protein
LVLYNSSTDTQRFFFQLKNLNNINSRISKLILKFFILFLYIYKHMCCSVNNIIQTLKSTDFLVSTAMHFNRRQQTFRKNIVPRSPGLESKPSNQDADGYLILQPWKWKQNVPPKSLSNSINLQSVTTWKIWLYTIVFVRNII